MYNRKCSSIAILLAMLACAPMQGWAAAAKSNESLQSEIDAINVELEYLKIKVSDNKKKTRSIESKIKSKKQEIQNLGSQIEQLAKNQEDAQIQIKKLEEENAESRQQLKELLTRFRDRLVQLHKIRQGTLVSSVVFAKDLNSFLNRYQMVKYLLESDREIIEELKSKDEKVRQTSEKLVQKNKVLEAGKEEITKKQKQLAKEQASLNAMLNTVLMEKKVFLKREKDLSSSRNQLEKQIAEAVKKVSEPGFEKELGIDEGTSAPTAKAVPLTGVPDFVNAPAVEKQPDNQIGSEVKQQPPAVVKETLSENSSTAAKLMNFSWPIEKSLREMVTEKGDDDSCAILIKPAADAEIIAAAKGKVLYKGFLNGLGDVVILGHQRGFSTVYARLDNVWVGLNEVVEQGTVIGKIDGGGMNGVLHFEIRFGGKKVPPLEYLPQ